MQFAGRGPSAQGSTISGERVVLASVLQAVPGFRFTAAEVPSCAESGLFFLICRGKSPAFKTFCGCATPSVGDQEVCSVSLKMLPTSVVLPIAVAGTPPLTMEESSVPTRSNKGGSDHLTSQVMSVTLVMPVVSTFTSTTTMLSDN